MKLELGCLLDRPLSRAMTPWGNAPRLSKLALAGLSRLRLRGDAAEAHERVGAERLHAPALDQFDAAVSLRPGHEPSEWEFRPQAERARRPSRQPLDHGQHAALG